MNQMTPDHPEMRELRASVRKILEKELLPHVEENEEQGTFCHQALIKLGELGFAAPIFAPPYGLHDYSLQSIVSEEMGRISCGFGLSALASVVLFGANISRKGSHEQKEKYLPGIASGQKIGCWALTEPDIGSDAVAIKTKYRRQGQDFIINGSKTFITNAPVADYLLILAKDEGATTNSFEGGTAFILEKNHPGMRVGKPLRKLGHWSSPTGEIFLENVKVPESAVLGRSGMAFYDMKESLDIERVIFSGLAIGLLDYCLEKMVRYGGQRQQFGRPILEYQMYQDKIATVGAHLDIMKTYLYNLLPKLQRGEKVTKEAAILKFVGAKYAFHGAAEAVQCLGGNGYMREYQVERCLRDAKLFEIGGGTTEVQKLIVTKSLIKEYL